MITIVLLLIAAVLFGVAAFGVAAARFNLVAAGLCVLTVALLLPHLGVG